MEFYLYVLLRNEQSMISPVVSQTGKQTDTLLLPTLRVAVTSMQLYITSLQHVFIDKPY